MEKTTSHHSIRKALHIEHKNHSTPDVNKEVTDSEKVDEEHIKHKHALKSHLHHLHKHNSDKLTHSMSEVELPDEHSEIPMAKESEIRHVMSI